MGDTFMKSTTRIAKGVGIVATILMSAPALAQTITYGKIGERAVAPTWGGTATSRTVQAQPGAAPPPPVILAPQPVVPFTSTPPQPVIIQPVLNDPVTRFLPLLDDMASTQALTGGIAPNYRPRPIRIRSLRLQPSVTVAGGYNNLSTADRASKTTGPVAQITPELNFDNGDAVNRISGNLRYTATRYTQARANDMNTFASSLRYERGTPELVLLRLHGSANREMLSRVDINNQPETREPVRYWQYLGEADLSHRSPILGWRLNMAVDRKLFSPSVDAQTGAIVDQSRRSHARWSVAGLATHQLRPGIEAVVSVEGNRHYYDALRNLGTSANPIVVSANSVGYEAMAGLNVQLNRRLLGTIQAGYMAQNFEDARIQNIAGLSYKVDLLYLLSKQSNLRLSARKKIDESSSYASPGRRRTNIDLTYTHDIRDNWRVTVSGNYDYFDYMIAGRQPYGYGASASSRISLNRNLSLITQAGYYRRDAGLTQDRLRYLTVMQGLELVF